MSQLRRSHVSRRFACATLVVAAFGAGGALAADPTPAKPRAGAASAPAPAAKSAAKAVGAAPREGSLGKGTSTLPTLTREELRQCLAEQDRIKKEGAELAQAQANMDKERADIERLGTELQADKAKVDTTDEAAVAAYNDRARQRTQRVEEFKAGAVRFNERVDKLVVDRQSYAAKCADRRFFEDDYEAIKAGQ